MSYKRRNIYHAEWQTECSESEGNYATMGCHFVGTYGREMIKATATFLVAIDILGEKIFHVTLVPEGALLKWD